LKISWKDSFFRKILHSMVIGWAGNILISALSHFVMVSDFR